MKNLKTSRTLRGTLLTFTFLVLSSGSVAQKMDAKATAAAPWKVGEVIATTVGEQDVRGRKMCLVNGSKMTCDYVREFLGANKEGYYLVQDFYAPQTVQQYLKGNQDKKVKKVKRTDPYLVSSKNAAQFNQMGALLLANLADVDGRITVWYLTGNKQLEIKVKKGLKQGVSSIWYENGRIENQKNYTDDKSDGSSTRWFDNGQMNFRFSYAMGNRHGQQEEWYRNGQLNALSFYVNGIEDGLFEVWDEDGQMVNRSLYAVGARHGKQEEWFANGRLRVLSYFTAGKMESNAQWWWYGDGKPNNEGKQISEAEAQQFLKKYNEAKGN